MSQITRHLIVLLMIFAMGLPISHIEASDFFTATGTVEVIENETLTITLTGKIKATLKLNVTSSSNVMLLIPQSHSGKTAFTQRTAKSSDLAKGQSIAVVYTDIDKVHSLLSAVIKPGTGLPVDEKSTKQDEFEPLVIGDDLNQFEIVDLDQNEITLKNGEFRLKGVNHKNGYFATRNSYRNYILQFDWMYEKHSGKPSDGNSGLIVHIQGPGKVWPKCIEAQIWYKEFGSFYTLDGGKFNPQFDDPKMRDKALKPLGEWSHQEVTCNNGAITLKVNDKEYARGIQADPDHGQIGWMFEGSLIRYRNLKIKPLK